MAVKTGKDYIERLKKNKPKCYILGKLEENPFEHPFFKPAIAATAMAHDAAHLPEYEELLTAKSHLTGEKIHRFTNIYQNSNEIIQKIKLNRALSHICPPCNVKCIGNDSMNAIYPTVYEIDQGAGTDYFKRFCKVVERVQKEDLVCSAGITDVKGDRSLRPSQQPDPDLYLRVVKRTSDGIDVRGAKAHQTGAMVSDLTFIAPTTTLTKEDKDYAVMFVVPPYAPGITHIYGRCLGDERRLEEGGTMDLGIQDYGVHRTTLMVFDDVFIPKEHVFMDGEWEYSRPLVTYFSTIHKLSSACCKAGIFDVIIGAAATIAEYKGLEKSYHINDKIATMMYLAESIYAEAIGAAVDSFKTPAGTPMPSIMLSNVCKLTLTKHPYEMCRMMTDIAGGLFRTQPSEKDWQNPEERPMIEKYLQMKKGVPVENIMRINRLIEYFMFGTASIEDLGHLSSGAIETSQLWIKAVGNIPYKKKLAQKLAGIKEEQVTEPKKLKVAKG